MSKSKILVVDNERPNVELLEGMLSKDYEIVTAYDGNAALIMVENTSPDIVLLDIMMPDISGYEICRKLKGNDKTKSIPIVMVTVLNERENRIKAIEAGADDFLSTPINMNELSARVKSLLRIKQQRDNSMFVSKAKPEFLANVNHSLQTLSNSTQVLVEHPTQKRRTRIENIVKSHLEIIVISMLSNRKMSGYDLIKEIFAIYNVFLSQGTVYPLLYSLKEEGILHAEFTKSDMRTKRYSPTQEGKQIIEKKINEFMEAEEYFLNSIKKRELYVQELY